MTKSKRWLVENDQFGTKFRNGYMVIMVIWLERKTLILTLTFTYQITVITSILCYINKTCFQDSILTVWEFQIFLSIRFHMIIIFFCFLSSSSCQICDKTLPTRIRPFIRWDNLLCCAQLFLSVRSIYFMLFPEAL